MPTTVTYTFKNLNVALHPTQLRVFLDQTPTNATVNSMTGACGIPTVGFGAQDDVIFNWGGCALNTNDTMVVNITATAGPKVLVNSLSCSRWTNGANTEAMVAGEVAGWTPAAAGGVVVCSTTGGSGASVPAIPEWGAAIGAVLLVATAMRFLRRR